MNTRSFQRIDVHKARELLYKQDTVLLDCRHPSDFQAGHIVGASLLGDYNADDYVLNVAKDRPVLIYCYHGNASQMRAQFFADFGFAEVYSLDGGYEAWRQVHAPANRQLTEALQCWLTLQGFPGADIHARTRDGVTPLVRAAGEGDPERVAELLAAGADPHQRNIDGNQALWFACVSENLDTLDLLVAVGANLNHQNDNGATCLMYAASAGKTTVVERLLAFGADRSLLSLDDFTALDMVANLECLNMLRETPRRIKAAT